MTAALFDPYDLKPDASLNRTRLAALPGAPREWIGQPAYDLLSSAALAHTDGETFGRRLGHLIATLSATPPPDDDTWRSTYLRYWSRVQHVRLGGGVAARLGPELAEIAGAEARRLGATCTVNVAPNPAVLALVGAARTPPAKATQRVVVDFGHTTVKRGIATLTNGALVRLDLLPPVDSDLVFTVATPGLERFVRETITDTRRHADDENAQVLVSVASYVQDGRPVDRGNTYGRLAQVDLGVRLMHDGTTAARAVATSEPTAVIVLGTGLGVGFAPPPDRVLNLDPAFQIL